MVSKLPFHFSHCPCERSWHDWLQKNNRAQKGSSVSHLKSQKRSQPEFNYTWEPWAIPSEQMIGERGQEGGVMGGNAPECLHCHTHLQSCYLNKESKPSSCTYPDLSNSEATMWPACHRAGAGWSQARGTFCSPQILPPTVWIPLTSNSSKWWTERQVLRPTETRGLLSLTPHMNVLREKCLIMIPGEYQVPYLSLISPSFLPHRWFLSCLGSSFNCFLS